jgi:hypothetical protein
MRRSTILTSIAAACLLVLAFACLASAEDWVLLGRKTVALGADRDELWVGEDMGVFRALKLRVFDSGVQFEKAVIVFRNGDIDDTPIREFIPAGGSTGVYDLPGGNRYIRKIVFHYTTRPGTLDRAEIEVWGLR